MSLIDLHPDAPRGRAPTRVTVHSRHPGHQLTESQALELDQVYTQFCNVKNMSMGGFHSDEFSLSDGTVVRIVSVNGNDEVDVYPSDDSTLFPRLISGIGLLMTDEFGDPLEGYTTEDDQVQPVVLEFGDKGSIKIRKPPKILGGDLMWVDQQRKFWTAASRLQAYACQGNDTIGAVRTPLESPVFRYPGTEPGTKRIGYFAKTGLGVLVFRSGPVQPPITGLDARTIISSDYLDDTEQAVTIPGGYTVSGVISPSTTGTQAVALGQSPDNKTDRAILFRITEEAITAELLNLGAGQTIESLGSQTYAHNYDAPLIHMVTDYRIATFNPGEDTEVTLVAEGQRDITYAQYGEYITVNGFHTEIKEEKLLGVRFSRAGPFIQKETEETEAKLGEDYTYTSKTYRSGVETGNHYTAVVVVTEYPIGGGEPYLTTKTIQGEPIYADADKYTRAGAVEYATTNKVHKLSGIPITTVEETVGLMYDEIITVVGTPEYDYYSFEKIDNNRAEFNVLHRTIKFRDADRPCEVFIETTNEFSSPDLAALWPTPKDFGPEVTSAATALVIRVGSSEVLRFPLPGLKARLTGDIYFPRIGEYTDAPAPQIMDIKFFSLVGPWPGQEASVPCTYYTSYTGANYADPSYSPYDPDRPSGQLFPARFVAQGGAGFTVFYAVDPITLALVIMVKYSGNGVPEDANDWAYVVSDAGTQPLAKVLGLPEGTRIRLVSNSQNSLKSI
jgi:hypothetical protein